MFKKAFTMAEVLIVLAIIGVVALLVLPNLSDSFKEEQNITKLKKIENDLELAYQKSINTYGNYALWTDTGKDRIPKFVETLKGQYCGFTPTCFPTVTGINTSNGSTATMELDDGVAIAISPDEANSKFDIYVALEGVKGGRTIGKSIFGFNLLYNEGIYPMGYQNDIDASNAYTGGKNTFNASNWAYSIGNMDYLKCDSELNWVNKTSCE